MFLLQQQNLAAMQETMRIQQEAIAALQALVVERRPPEVISSPPTVISSTDHGHNNSDTRTPMRSDAPFVHTFDPHAFRATVEALDHGSTMSSAGQISTPTLSGWSQITQSVPSALGNDDARVFRALDAEIASLDGLIHPERHGHSFLSPGSSLDPYDVISPSVASGPSVNRRLSVNRNPNASQSTAPVGYAGSLAGTPAGSVGWRDEKPAAMGTPIQPVGLRVGTPTGLEDFATTEPSLSTSIRPAQVPDFLDPLDPFCLFPPVVTNPMATSAFEAMVTSPNGAFEGPPTVPVLPTATSPILTSHSTPSRATEPPGLFAPPIVTASSGNPATGGPPFEVDPSLSKRVPMAAPTADVAMPGGDLSQPQAPATVPPVRVPSEPVSRPRSHLKAPPSAVFVPVVPSRSMADPPSSRTESCWVTTVQSDDESSLTPVPVVSRSGLDPVGSTHPFPQIPPMVARPPTPPRL